MIVEELMKVDDNTTVYQQCSGLEKEGLDCHKEKNFCYRISVIVN